MTTSDNLIREAPEPVINRAQDDILYQLIDDTPNLKKLLCDLEIDRTQSGLASDHRKRVLIAQAWRDNLKA